MKNVWFPAISYFSFLISLLKLEFSLNTCLQMTYRKTEMETSSELFVQDGRECGWCSSERPRGVAVAYLQCTFFACWVRKCDPFQSSEEMLATRRAAGSSWWRRDLTQCFQIQSKWMWRPDKVQFRFFKISFECHRNGNVDVTIHTAQTLSFTWLWAPREKF